ncbi:MAG TPA: allantoate amidohydrolase [Rhodoglobus sp.]|nr:allantoate amidohydrolase [Rhodoglobus sp.]
MRAETVLERCDELATISSSPEHLTRVHLSPEHRAANDLVDGWMRQAGLSTWQDAAGNLVGRREGREPDLPALVLGSHLDTVPDAGRYDGMLGVLLAIAVVERLRDAVLPFAIEVVAFSDEEGTRFGNALLGSRAFAGTWDDAWWELEDAEGLSLRDAFVDFGLDPARLPGAFRRPEEFVGYLEAHIEQGPILEEADRRLAVVTSIAGARRFELILTGQAGHAGGARIERRRDALVGAAEVVLEVERVSRERGVIGTVGRIEAEPGGVNVVPGRAVFSLDLRAEDDAARDAAVDEIVAFARDVSGRRRLDLDVHELYRADATLCDPGLRAAVEAGIRSTGDDDPLAFWSRAGHDGMAVAAIAPVAMLFLRCGGGISHAPEESVRADDVEAALAAYEATVRELARTR